MEGSVLDEAMLSVIDERSMARISECVSARQADGVSIVQQAYDIGVERKSLMECSRRKHRPSAMTVVKMALYYGVTADWPLGLS